MYKERLSTESYKGVRDFFPKEQALLNYTIATWRAVAERWGYVEYGASILEPSELYKQKGVENEEIVSEQTYSFTDRGDREVTLRPEMTPTVARMVAQKRREMGFPLRWYSVPNCFRYERPQRGRLREFWQFNADIFGSRSSGADAEIIALAYDLMKAFGASESDFSIRVSSRSHLDTMAAEAGLDEAGKKKLLALLDRKAKLSQLEFETGLTDLGIVRARVEAAEPPQEVARVLETLQEMGVGNASFDPSVVRGFAYYTGVVFEIFDLHPSNNRALMGGGRYDNLTQMFDDDPLPGTGFAVSDEVVRIFLESRGLLPDYMPPTKVYVAVADEAALGGALRLAGELRAAGVATAADFGERRLSDQIKAAGKQDIPYLIVVGPDELSTDTFAIRDLASGKEVQLPRAEVPHFFSALNK
jgi:histidyl-tRNA synthetase